MNINEIISGLGLELSEEQRETLTQAVSEGYVTREEHQKELEHQQFEALLEARMTAAGARNPKAVRAMLDMDSLAQSPDRETVDGALAALKATDGYLFSGLPSLAAGTGTANPNPRPDIMSAIRRAALG